MNLDQIKDRINSLLIKGESQNALNILFKFTHGTKKKEIIILGNRLSEIKRKTRFGIVSNQEEQLEINKINHSILELLESLGEDYEDSKLIQKSEKNKRPKSNTAQIVLAICAIVTLIVAMFNYSSKNVNNQGSSQRNNLETPTYLEKEITSSSLDTISKDKFESSKIPSLKENHENKTVFDYNKFEFELAVEHILSDSIIEDNAFTNLILEDKFDKALDVIDIAQTKTNDKYKLARIESRRKSIYLIREKNLDNAWISFPRAMILTEKNKKLGLLDRKGNEVSPPRFDEIDPIFFGELYCTKLNGMYGFFNGFGKEIFASIFTDVNPVDYDPMLMVKKDGYYGFIDQEGIYIIEPIFSEIKRVWSDLIFVQKNRKWGAINLTGNQILDIKYDEIDFLKRDAIIYATKNGKGKYFDLNGRITKNPALE